MYEVTFGRHQENKLSHYYYKTIQKCADNNTQANSKTLTHIFYSSVKLLVAEFYNKRPYSATKSEQYETVYKL